MKISPRRLITALAALCLGIGAALGMIAAPAQAAASATTEQTFLTFYGWWDNTPPGADIAYPQIHQTAGGTGTYADPITFATDSSEQPPGTIVYVPRVGKYFIMEDGCDECSSDWNGHGPNGGPNLRHLDLWLGGKGGNAFDAIECEDALTNYNSDGTPTMEPVIVNPPSNETVSSPPIFNTGTGACYGGAKPTITVGQYKNVSTGKCMTDPNNSSSAGALLVTAACDSTAAGQRFTFDGTFLQINNLCADYSTSQISMQKCTAGPEPTVVVQHRPDVHRHPDRQEVHQRLLGQGQVGQQLQQHEDLDLRPGRLRHGERLLRGGQPGERLRHRRRHRDRDRLHRRDRRCR